MIRKFPYVQDDKEWKNMVNSEFYCESRNLGRRLTDVEKKGIVRSLKRHLYLKDESVGLNPTRGRVYRVSVDHRSDFGLSVAQRFIGSVESYEDLYVEFLSFKRNFIDDVLLLVQNHHKKNVKSMLNRIDCPGLERLLKNLFNVAALECSNKKGSTLWSEYSRLCSITQFTFFYMIILGYLGLFSEIKIHKYYLFDPTLGINGSDLNYLCKNYLSYFIQFSSEIAHQKKDSSEVSHAVLKLIGCVDSGHTSEIILRDRKDELKKMAGKCLARIKQDLLDYGMKQDSVTSLVNEIWFYKKIEDNTVADTKYFSELLKESQLEYRINEFLNNLRDTRSSASVPLGDLRSKLVGTKINYIEFNWPELEIYDGSNLDVYHSMVKPLVEYDFTYDSPSGFSMFGGNSTFKVLDETSDLDKVSSSSSGFMFSNKNTNPKPVRGGSRGGFFPLKK